jgi:hypothetical protein
VFFSLPSQTVKSPEYKSPKQPLFQVLSLDVVLGSLAVGIFATSLLDVKANPWWWLILPVSVWVVYTLDHLLDGFNLKGNSTIYRHNFHFQNRKIIISIMIVFGLAAIVLAFFFLDARIIKGGIGLGLIVLLYQGLNAVNKRSDNFFFQKEFFIAVVYIVGIFLAPVVWHNMHLSGERLSIALILIALVFAESVIISWYDFENDKADGLPSFTINFGKTKTRKFIRLFLAGIFLLNLFFIFYFQSDLLRFLLILLAMNATLFLLLTKPTLFQKNNLFRWIGESVFYLPGLAIFF